MDLTRRTFMKAIAIVVGAPLMVREVLAAHAQVITRESIRGAHTVALKLFYRGHTPSGVTPVWSDGIELDPLNFDPESDFAQHAITSLKHLGLNKGSTYQFVLMRDTEHQFDNLIGDWSLLGIDITGNEEKRHTLGLLSWAPADMHSDSELTEDAAPLVKTGSSQLLSREFDDCQPESVSYTGRIPEAMDDLHLVITSIPTQSLRRILGRE